MEVSSLSGIQPVQPGGAAQPAGGQKADRGAREAEAAPAPSQMLALPAAHPAAVQAAMQQAASRPAEPRAVTESRGSAQRGYGAAAHLLDTAKSFAERITLIPEPGDLSLEASRLPPNGTAREEEGAGPRDNAADKRDREA